MSRKIAPNLTEWSESADRHGLEFHKPMKRELCALLAVARAAERLIVRRPGYFIVRDGIQYAKPLRDALARLSPSKAKPVARGRSGSAGRTR